MARRIRLTAKEIEAVLAVAGNALPVETFNDDPDATEAEKEAWVEAYERGMDKLRAMLARLETANDK
jgi:hypothetical protein